MRNHVITLEDGQFIRVWSDASKVYTVAKRFGTEEEEFSDTVFAIGEQSKVLEWLKDGGTILNTNFDSLDTAKKWFYRNHGTYNNFDFKTEYFE
jgi:hypothetical protein